jgi:Predicted nucleotide-binding protein containing TIR-like domain
MPTTALEGLTGLKQELQGIPADPWSNVESWIAKATPIIRRDWPDHSSDFLRAAATPRWKVHVGAIVSDTDETSAKRANRVIASSGKQKLLNFLDGLIAIAEPPAPAPKQRRSRGDKPAPRKRMPVKRKVDARKVFVVHGRNTAARDALFDLLRAIGFHPLEWDEMVHETGEGLR